MTPLSSRAAAVRFFPSWIRSCSWFQHLASCVGTAEGVDAPNATVLPLTPRTDIVPGTQCIIVLRLILCPLRGWFWAAGGHVVPARWLVQGPHGEAVSFTGFHCRLHVEYEVMHGHRFKRRCDAHAFAPKPAASPVLAAKPYTYMAYINKGHPAECWRAFKNNYTALLRLSGPGEHFKDC